MNLFDYNTSLLKSINPFLTIGAQALSNTQSLVTDELKKAHKLGNSIMENPSTDNLREAVTSQGESLRNAAFASIQSSVNVQFEILRHGYSALIKGKAIPNSLIASAETNKLITDMQKQTESVVASLKLAIDESIAWSKVLSKPLTV